MNLYRKKLLQPMRPYVEGESLDGVSVAECDTPEVGGMVAVSPDNEADKWYIAKQFFNDNYEEAGSSAKSLQNTDQDTCRSNVSDVVIFGEDLFKLLSKASSTKEGWMKSTKAMQVIGGCVVQVTTQQANPDGSYVVAEALTYVPGVRILAEVDFDNVVTGRTLVGIG